jgi:hypothetical protein
MLSACEININIGGSSSSQAASSAAASSSSKPGLASKAEAASSQDEAADADSDSESKPWDDPDWGKDWFSSEDYEDPDMPEDFELFDPWAYDDFDPAPYEGDGPYDPLEDYEVPVMPGFPDDPLNK